MGFREIELFLVSMCVYNLESQCVYNKYMYVHDELVHLFVCVLCTRMCVYVKFIVLYLQMKGALKSSPDQVLRVHEKLFAGSSAGVMAQTAIYPLEVWPHTHLIN